MSEVLKYKGYNGTVEYDSEDDLLIGHIIGINDSINYHGASIEEIKASFIDAVENYISLCEKIGKVPEKEYSGRFTIRIDPNCHKKIALIAETQKISIGKVIEDAVAAYEQENCLMVR